MSEKKQMSTFTKIYLSIISVLLIILIVAAFILNSVLSAYETTRPHNVAKEVFANYFQTLDFGGLIEQVSANGKSFESSEKINDGVKSLFNPADLTYFSISTDVDGSEKFAVTSGNKRIAYFTVSPTAEEAGFGFNYCKVSDVELFFATYGDITIRVPVGYILKINGLDVDDSYITASNVPDAVAKFLPVGVNGITYNDYNIRDLFFEPEISVLSPDGKTANITYSEKDQIYKASVLSDKQLEDAESKYVIKAASAYATYMSKDAARSEVTPYLDKTSGFYKAFIAVENAWNTKHYEYKITNEKATEFHKYSDDIYTCRVTLDYTRKKNNREDYTEHNDWIFCMKKSGDKYLVYDILSNN